MLQNELCQIPTHALDGVGILSKSFRDPQCHVQDLQAERILRPDTSKFAIEGSHFLDIDEQCQRARWIGMPEPFADIKGQPEMFSELLLLIMTNVLTNTAPCSFAR